MKHLKLIFFLLILVCSSGTLKAQEKGIIKFLVEVDNGYFEIEINDTMLLRRYKDTLPAGDYQAKIWSPGYVTKPINFTVVAGKTVEKHVKMAKNNDFIRYEEEYRVYRNQFHKQFTAPLSLTLASAVTTGVFMVRAYDLKRKIETDIADYHLSPTTAEIDIIKTRIASNNASYDRHRRLYYAGLGFTALCVGGTVWSYINFNKNNTEPTYYKESPFKEKYSFNITPYGCSFTLHL